MKYKNNIPFICILGVWLVFAEQQAIAQDKIDKLITKGDYQKAQAYCEKQSGESRTTCYNKLADTYFTLGYYDKASEYYEKSNNKEGLEKLGDIYFNKKEFVESIKYYEKAFVDNLQKLQEAYIKIADSYYRSENIEEALMYYEKSDCKMGYKMLGNMYYENEEYEKAIENYEKVGIDTIKKYIESCIKIADAYFDNKEYDKAVILYDKAKFKQGLEKIGDVYFNRNETDKAEFYFNKATKVYKTAIANNIFAEVYYYDIWVDKNSGKAYKTVTIGMQEWMVKNLTSTHYANGDKIPVITDAKTWSTLTKGAYCVYNNDIKNADEYGYLYNYYAAYDKRNVCPAGWHVPAIDEFEKLENYLGGYDAAGGKVKTTGITHWNTPNRSATNISGFSALPAGMREKNGTYKWMGLNTYWWVINRIPERMNEVYRASSSGTQLTDNHRYITEGCSVRCIKD